MRKFAFSAAFALVSVQAFAAEMVEQKTYEVAIKNHAFEPAQIKIMANQEALLLVKNLDSTPEEFESHDLKIEKVIAGNSEAKIKLPALEAGTYKFVGEFNEDSARGAIIAE